MVGTAAGLVPRARDEADVVWKFDMIAEVGAFPHNLANSSPVSFGDLVYVSTSNGHDEGHVKLPSPGAPSAASTTRPPTRRPSR